MSVYDVPDHDGLERLRGQFRESMAADRLMQSLEAATTVGRPSASRLYLRATGGRRPDDGDLDRQIARDPRLRSLYRQIVSATASYPGLELMAASSGAGLGRKGVGYRIHPPQPSRAQPSQHYLIIEFEGEPDRPPSRMIIVDVDERCYEFSLPAVRDRVMQLVVDDGSELWRLLHQPKAEVYLQ